MITEGFLIESEPRAVGGFKITCRRCGMTSHNPNDVRHRYCGKCHDFHSDPAQSGTPASRVGEETASCPTNPSPSSTLPSPSE